MKVEEVVVKADNLKATIQGLINDFMSETGCRPEVSIQYSRYDELGRKPRFISRVEIDVVLL